jgi:anti-sigma B factor antagonist
MRGKNRFDPGMPRGHALYLNSMDSEKSPDGEVVLFRPELRKIDLLNSEAFHASLLSLMRGKSRLVLDLSNVQFIDSSGLGKIVASLRSFRESGGEMRICGVQPPVHVLFTMVRLGEIVGIDADARSATLGLRGAAAPESGSAR